MDPAVWGPPCWRLVFTACFRLPRSRCLEMFEALRHVLPCVHCRKSYRMYLERLPPPVAIDPKDGAVGCAKFAWAIKDYVNGKLGAGAIPFSTLCARHEVFGCPLSRMDVTDLLCCMAVQIESDDQIGAYEAFAQVMADLVVACGERALPLKLPLEAKFRSPPTCWLHAMKTKNLLCTELALPTLTRDEMLARYRREANPTPSHADTPLPTPRPTRPTPRPTPRPTRLTPRLTLSSSAPSRPTPRSVITRSRRRR